MKRISLALALLLSVASFAQRGGERGDHRRPEFTKEQKIQLKLKKLTVALDLTRGQINKIEPIVVKMINEKENRKAEKEANRGKRKDMSADELFEMKMERLDQEAKLHRKMKSILDKKQYWAWKAIHAKHKHHKKEMMKKSKHKHHRKDRERGEEI